MFLLIVLQLLLSLLLLLVFIVRVELLWQHPSPDYNG